MVFTRAFTAFLSSAMVWTSFAQAYATHTADVSVELFQMDEKGKERSLEEISGNFYLDWNTKKCEVRLKKDQFVYCTLDTSTDIKNSKGDLVMKAMPQAHFDGGTIDALLRRIGDETKLKKIFPKIVSDTSSERSKGFDLPFYTCGDCEKTGKDLVLYNAYQSFVARDLTVKHIYLAGKPLVLRLTIKKMEAIKGAFNIIGNSNASQYGQ